MLLSNTQNPRDHEMFFQKHLDMENLQS
jgi:hypothetical protein